MDDLMMLRSIEAIKSLRARFARSMDTKDWKALQDCIAEDCVFDCTQEAGIEEPWLGAEAIVGNIRRSFASAITVHHAHTPEIEIISEVSARAVWAMQDLLRFPGFPTIDLAGFGHYHEEYERGSDGRWRLKRYALTRLRVDVVRTFLPGQEPPVPPLRKTRPERTVKAVHIQQHGGPEVLRLTQVAEPIPGEGEVLLRVAGAGVNPVDLKARAGAFGLFMPLAFPAQLGGDVSGVIEVVGPGVTSFAVGDAVMGMINPLADGAYAEKIVVRAALLALVPPGIDLAEAAALPMAALTGSQLIERALVPATGDRVLVIGAGGGVGRAAVYAAVAAGAIVVAGVRAGNEVLRGLPVETVIDVNDIDQIACAGPFDGIADTVGGLVAERAARFLKRGGTLASVVSPPPVPDADFGVTVVPLWVEFDAPRLIAWAQEAAAGRYRIPIAHKLPLDQAAAAHRLAERGSVGGKILLLPGG